MIGSRARLATIVTLAACQGQPSPQFGHSGSGGGENLPSSTTLTAAEPGAGFGAAVATGAAGTWAAAPFGATGQIYAIAGESADLALEGDGRLGAALAATARGLVAGAPLAGQVLDQDGQELLADLDSAGLALAAADDTWVAATATGWVGSDGSSGTASARPGSVALSGGTVAIGMPHGEACLLVGTATLSRPTAYDEAGYALAAGDVDDDGQVEWIVGAPGAGAVYVVAPDGRSVEVRIEAEQATGTPGGRFGHALAVADVDDDGIDDLVVGAPASGDDVAGAAYLFTGGELTAPTSSWTGSQAGAQLGFAVAAKSGRIVLGAPGGAETQGSVRLITP